MFFLSLSFFITWWVSRFLGGGGWVFGMGLGFAIFGGVGGLVRLFESEKGGRRYVGYLGWNMEDGIL